MALFAHRKSQYGEAPIKLDTYDDGWKDSPIFIMGHEFGPTMLVRASGFEAAHEIWIDESPTIPIDDVPEAYGFNTQEELDTATQRAMDGDGEWPDLLEGYQTQSNCTGSGIVNEGHYAWISEFVASEWPEYALSMCECSDPGCDEHEGTSACKAPATTRVVRVDLADDSPILFCEECADDAHETGFFEELE